MLKREGVVSARLNPDWVYAVVPCPRCGAKAEWRRFCERLDEPHCTLCCEEEGHTDAS